MQIRNLALVAVFAGMSSLAAQSVSGWRPLAGHPELQYQIKCQREEAIVMWRNHYPGAVTLTAGIKSYSYQGVEDVTVPPDGSAQSPLETMQCSPEGFGVNVSRFFMAAPPPRKAAVATAQPKAPVAQKAPEVLIPPYTRPEKLPTVSRTAVEAVKVGMSRDQVLRALGAPASQVAIPEEDQLLESLHYSVSDDEVSTIRLTNGVVSSVTLP